MPRPLPSAAGAALALTLAVGACAEHAPVAPDAATGAAAAKGRDAATPDPRQALLAAIADANTRILPALEAPTATASLAAALGDLAASLTTSSGAGTAVALARAEQALGTLESRDPGLAPDLAAVRLVLARAGEWAAVPTN